MEEEKSGLKKETIIILLIGLLVGVLIGALAMYFVNGGKNAVKVAGKTITTNDLYNKMKTYYSINLVLEDVDAAILNKKYDLNDEELDEIKETAEYYINQYEQYGYTQEEFLAENGFDDYDDFVNYLSVDYKRTIYYYDYLESQLEDGAVSKYYDENSFGKINNKHILVKVSDSMTDEQALTIANEIIGRLDAGEDFDTVANEYVAKDSSNIVTEDLGKIGAFDNIESSYLEALKTLEKGKYVATPVKTSYGYHVIYCVDREEKSNEISRKDKMAIIDVLAADIMEGDSNLYYKALIQLREDSKLKFYDKDLKTKYEEYCAGYEDTDANE